MNMELSEIVNPHYAFPVVGVLLCAFLVFAFGFKSPTLPPSFGFEERKTSVAKRRRVTAVNKKSSQNSHLSTETDPNAKRNVEKVPKPQIEKASTSPKSKSQNAHRLATELSANKQVIKNKKNEKNEKNALKKKEDEVLEKRDKDKLKVQDGEWVQLLSRKEKKNRKREEVQGGGDDEEVKDSSKEATPDKRKTLVITDFKATSPIKRKKKVNKDGDKKESHQVQGDTNVILDAEPDEKAAVRELKDDATVKIGFDELVCKLNELDDAKGQSSNKIEVPDVEVQPEREVSNSKSKKRNKNRSELGDEARSALIADSAVNEPSPESVPLDAEQVANNEVPRNSSKPMNNAAAGGVAFDELGDVWQEPKNQKKKKKARKDQ